PTPLLSITGKSFMIPRCAKQQCRKLEKKTDLIKRVGELTEDREVRIFTGRQTSHQHRIPSLCLIRQKDGKDAGNKMIMVNGVDNKLHEELKQLEKIQDWCIFWTYLKSLEHSKT
uniref:Uncharacterized protein n=1 Tax=Bubo bubo TaxID=30461 RepID=A0A8C0EI49_BUBBB